MQLEGSVGIETFGFNRYINQQFYRSREWKRFRQQIILRDNGCDLAIDGRNIVDRIILHHLNPLTEDDLKFNPQVALDPENVICVSPLTHNAIHYSDESILVQDFIERKPNDMCPWR